MSMHRILPSVLLLLGLLVLVGLFAPPARATGIVVNDTGDTLNSPGCATTGTGTCTLRDAITFANANSGGDVITFSVSGTISLGSALPAIDDTLTIDGTGQTIAVSGAGTYRVLEVNSGKTLTVKALTIENGKGAAGCSDGHPVNCGGGIYNAGTLTVTNSTFDTNSGGNRGGGIYNAGTLSVTNSTFADNTGDTFGGAIFNGTSGMVTVTKSTFSNNGASGGSGGGIANAGTLNVTNSTFDSNTGTLGGGIANNGTLNVTNTTFSGNGASTGSGGGGIYTSNAPISTTTLKNSILANSTNGNCATDSGSTLTADSHNLADDNTCDSATQKTSGEINLGSLADNGGPTQTIALLVGSAAIDAGDDAVCSASPVSGKDQRGVTRPQGAHCDIGAFESTNQLGPNLVVNDSADTDDGSCDAPVAGTSFNCTLREAINQANAHGGADTITFNIPASDGGCSGANHCTITLTSPLPAIDDNLTINGSANAAQIIIDGQATHRVFALNSGETLNVNTLTIANGKGANCGGFDCGGGIYNDGGTLNVSNSTFDSNIADGGGGIYSASGTVNVTGSTFTNNSSGGGDGGAIDNGGTLNVTNSTFSGNNALNGAGIINRGTLTVINSTISGNSAALQGGGIANDAGTTTLKNTIITNSSGTSNCSNAGTLSADSSNLADDNTCGSATQKTLAEINLGSLADNGGPTETIALNSGSAAIDTGNDAICAAAPVNNRDQRGYVRPAGAHCDVGAYEFGASPPTGCTGKPAAPKLKRPVKDAVLSTKRPTLKWKDVACETKYKIQVIDTATGDPAFSGKVDADVTQVKTSPLTPGATYKWFVKACKGAKCTKSETRVFHLQ